MARSLPLRRWGPDFFFPFTEPERLFEAYLCVQVYSLTVCHAFEKLQYDLDEEEE